MAESQPQEKRNTLTVTDNRTGKTYEIPIDQSSINPVDLKQIRANEDDYGLVCLDPGYVNTACCESKVSFIDGEKGILRYRGYDIEELVEKSTFLEVAYLLIYGELPDREQKEHWETKISRHTFIHEDLCEMMKHHRYDAHPMGVLISSIAAMGTFYPEANPALKGVGIYQDIGMRNKQIFRILGKLPTIAAVAYRLRIGRPINYPNNDLSYPENFLYMLDRLTESNYKPHPVLAKVLDKLFIIHAEHEINCSTATMRQLTSTLVDPYSATAGAAAALYGPLHGGANEAVLRMLRSIGRKENCAQFLEDVKARKKKLMGFGHRIYKSYDPRAKIMKNLAREIFELLGTNPLMEVAEELERLALADDFFIKRRLHPNVDFYSGLIYNALGFPTDMFPVLFTIPRVAGWLAHWVESLESGEPKLFRPRQVFTGENLRPYVPLDERPERAGKDDDKENPLRAQQSTMATRRQVSIGEGLNEYLSSGLHSEQYSIPKTIHNPL